MKYEVNFFSAKKGWDVSLIRMGEKLRSFFTSAALLMTILAGLIVLTVYVSIIIPQHRIPTVKRAQIRDLNLSLHNLKAERNILLSQANTLLQLKGIAIRWEKKFVSLGKAVNGDIWLTKMAFDEGKKGEIPIRERINQALKKSLRVGVLTIEGSTRAKQGQPQIGIVARLIDTLNNDPSFSDHFEKVELQGIMVDERDPTIANFRLKARVKENTSTKGQTLGHGSSSK